MGLFVDILIKIIPLYLFIFLGFIAGKFLNVKKESLASLLIYIIAPIIVFNGSFAAKLDISSLSLPFVFLFLCCLICLLFYYVGGFIWKDSTRNIMAFASATGNTGYFGLPVALAIFGNDIMSIAVLSLLGFILFENTVGFFIVAKGHHTAKEALTRLLRLPSLYAFFIGILCNILKLNLGQTYLDSIITVKGAYSFLGMMMIGIAIAGIKDFKFDMKFTGLTFFAKFLFWPLVVFVLIWLDSNYLFFWTSQIHKMMILFSVVPIAANTVAYATELNTHPEKMAFTVLLSTLFALFYIPFVNMIFLS